MPAGTETLLLTRDLDVVATVHSLLPQAEVDWHRTFTSGLTGITRDTRVLIIDAAAGVPMSHLLAALFLDQRPGRTAIVVQPADQPVRANADPRVQVLQRPFTADALSEALEDGARMAEDCRAVEALARLGAAALRCSPDVAAHA